MAPKNLCFFIFSCASLFFTCHSNWTFSIEWVAQPQSHIPIYNLPPVSKWSILLFMERSLCCTFSLWNSAMIHNKSWANFILLAWKLLTWSQSFHSVPPVNMMLAFGRCALSRIYIFHRASPLNYCVEHALNILLITRIW